MILNCREGGQVFEIQIRCEACKGHLNYYEPEITGDVVDVQVDVLDHECVEVR